MIIQKNFHPIVHINSSLAFKCQFWTTFQSAARYICTTYVLHEGYVVSDWDANWDDDGSIFEKYVGIYQGRGQVENCRSSGIAGWGGDGGGAGTHSSRNLNTILFINLDAHKINVKVKDYLHHDPINIFGNLFC